MYHKIIVVGNLGNDPQLNVLPSGDSVCNFSLASNKVSGSGGNKKEITSWFRVSVFGRQAENAQHYLSKGRLVLVEGELRPDPETGGPRIWTSNDGVPRAAFEMTAYSVKFLGGLDRDSEQHREEDEIPF